jgi:hypothetical protein
MVLLRLTQLSQLSARPGELRTKPHAEHGSVQTTNNMDKMKLVLAIAAAALFAASPLVAHEGHDDKEDLAAGVIKKISGEVVDLACYVDHNATGEKHTDCAKRCIASGLPVGLKADDGKTYLLIGEHKPLNDELAQYAAKKITVEGKVVSRDGIYLIENAVIQK